MTFLIQQTLKKFLSSLEFKINCIKHYQHRFYGRIFHPTTEKP